MFTSKRFKSNSQVNLAEFAKKTQRRNSRVELIGSFFLLGILSASCAYSVEDYSSGARDGARDTHEAPAKKKEATKKGLQRWFPNEECWFDLKRKIVVIGGEICQREGVLEMFACPSGTKEHESIVAVHCRAATAHAYLLAVGAQPGSPVTYQPDYSPAKGPQIDVYVLWKDERGVRHKRKAQELVRYVKTGREMDHNWVFAGSQFITDEDGKEYYLADWDGRNFSIVIPIDRCKRRPDL